MRLAAESCTFTGRPLYQPRVFQKFGQTVVSSSRDAVYVSDLDIANQEALIRLACEDPRSGTSSLS